MYHKLPEPIRRLARRRYQQFARDPNYPSLDFKPLQGYGDLYRVKISDDYRAVAVREGDRVTWIWIGSHARFDRDFR